MSESAGGELTTQMPDQIKFSSGVHRDASWRIFRLSLNHTVSSCCLIDLSVACRRLWPAQSHGSMIQLHLPHNKHKSSAHLYNKALVACFTSSVRRVFKVLSCVDLKRWLTIKSSYRRGRSTVPCLIDCDSCLLRRSNACFYILHIHFML